MSFEQLWAEVGRLQAEADFLRPRVEAYQRVAEVLRAYVDFRCFDERFDHGGAMNATQLSERDIYRRIRDNARAALAELDKVKG